MHFSIRSPLLKSTQWTQHTLWSADQWPALGVGPQVESHLPSNWGVQKIGSITIRICPLSNNCRCRHTYIDKNSLFSLRRASLRIGPTRAWHFRTASLSNQIIRQIHTSIEIRTHITQNKIYEPIELRRTHTNH